MEKDKVTNIQELKTIVQSFCEERDWDQYHSAKELAIGAVTESSELLEMFRFLSLEQVEELMANPKKKSEVQDELADILFFILRMCGKYEIDLTQSFHNKMEKNSKRYSAEEFRGKNHKANHL